MAAFYTRLASGSDGSIACMSTESPDRSKSKSRTVELIVQRPVKDNNVSNLIRYIDRIVALTKAFAWPLLCLSLFMYLRHPIIAVASQMPTIISQSSKLSVGTLSFEIRERADATGNRELGALIEGLSPEAVEDLLKIGRNSWIQLISREERRGRDRYFFPTEKRLRSLIELVERQSAWQRVRESNLPLNFIQSRNFLGAFCGGKRECRSASRYFRR